jgi:hypothetical protein
MEGWVERELAGCEFPDQRLKSRLGKVLKHAATGPTELQRQISGECHSWNGYPDAG